MDADNEIILQTEHLQDRIDVPYSLQFSNNYNRMRELWALMDYSTFATSYSVPLFLKVLYLLFFSLYQLLSLECSTNIIY